jgi:adenylate cyclase
MSRRLFILITIAIVVSALGTFTVRAIPAVHRLELLTYKWHMRAMKTGPSGDHVVLVGMDQESLAHLPLDRPVYPLPRSVHAQLLRELHDAGAKAVGFDIMFIGEFPNEDPTLAAAMRDGGTVLAGAKPATITLDPVTGERFTFDEVAQSLRPYLRQVSLLVQNDLGVMWIYPSVADEKTGKRYMHMSMALAAAYLGADGDGILHDFFQVGPIKAPVGRAGELYVRFAGPAGTIQPIPYYEVFSGTWRQTRGENFFKDKIVLVGIFDQFMDRHNTPMGEMQGVEVLAQETESILAGQWITHWSEAANYGFRLLLCAILALATAKFGLRRALLVAIAEGAIWVTAAHQVFSAGGIWVDTVEPVGTLALTLVAFTGYEAGRIRRVFRRFMPSSIADQMLTANPEQAVSSIEKEITVVFCDVRGSTALGEQLTPDQLDKLLREYFVAGEEAALRLGTELDKFVGDEIMLFFESKPGFEDHPIRGVQWALAMHDASRRISETGMAGEMGFRVGVGLCTGRARLGLTGARHRIQHTVIGDVVNTASRLQSATKELNRATLMDQSTWERVKAHFKTEDLGEISVKGKQNPVRIFSVFETVDL